jgi:hypothetical protein
LNQYSLAIWVLDRATDPVTGEYRRDMAQVPALLTQTKAWADHLVEAVKARFPGDADGFDLVGGPDQFTDLSVGWRIGFNLKLPSGVDRVNNPAWFDPALPLPQVARFLNEWSVADIIAGYTNQAGLVAAYSQPATVVNAYDPDSPLQVAPGETYTAPEPPPAVVTNNNTTPATVSHLAPGQTLLIAAVADVTVHNTYGTPSLILLRPGADFTPTAPPAATVYDQNNGVTTNLAPGQNHNVPFYDRRPRLRFVFETSSADTHTITVDAEGASTYASLSGAGTVKKNGSGTPATFPLVLAIGDTLLAARATAGLATTLTLLP